MELELSKPVEENVPAAQPPKQDYRGLLGRMLKQVALYVLLALLTYGCFQFSHQHILQTVQIEGTSMSPTLPHAQCYLLNRAVYHMREPATREIVVLRDPETNGYCIKRIVAKPGDSVFVKGGQIFVNGQLLPEPYLQAGTKTFPDMHYRAQLWVCGVNQYFVLGDNRNNSADSRVYGTVPRQNILGLVTP
jgi:signal peptidase I